MTVLVLGLLIFLGAHSVRIVADGWRGAQIARLGEARWKGWFSLVSIAGLVLIVWGYGMTRAAPVELWSPPAWTRHVASLFALLAFVLVAAAYVPGNRIRAMAGHPMVAGIKLWAAGHLLANGRLGDLVLFGAFLAWAVLDFRAARRRDRAAGVRREGSWGRAGIAAAAGLVAGIVFALWLHAPLVGVRPFGGA